MIARGKNWLGLWQSEHARTLYLRRSGMSPFKWSLIGNSVEFITPLQLDDADAAYHDKMTLAEWLETERPHMRPT